MSYKGKMNLKKIKSLIKNYKDFPRRGIIFRDISPVLVNSKAFISSIDAMKKLVLKLKFNKIMAVDARGFIFASVLAHQTKSGLVMCRKPSKLPGNLISEKFGYEYDKTSLSVEKELFKRGDKVLVVDDVLATGNTSLASYKLLKKTEAKPVGLLFFLGLDYLKGREFLEKKISKDFPIFSLINLDK